MTQKSSSPSLAVGLLSSAVPFLRRSGDVNVCWSEGRSSVSSAPSVQSEPIQRVGPIKYSARYSRGGFSGGGALHSLFSFCFYPRKIHGAGMLFSPASHSSRQNTVVYCCSLSSSTGALMVQWERFFLLYLKGSWSISMTLLLPHLVRGVSGFQKWFSESWSVKFEVAFSDCFPSTVVCDLRSYLGVSFCLSGSLEYNYSISSSHKHYSFSPGLFADTCCCLCVAVRLVYHFSSQFLGAANSHCEVNQ